MRSANRTDQLFKTNKSWTNSRLFRILHRIFLGWPYQLLTIPFLIAVMFPLVWLVYSSLKTDRDLFTSVWSLPNILNWDNYIRAWVKAGISQYFLNSVFVTAMSLIGTITLGAMAAYVLARFKFPGNHFIYLGVVVGMMVPTFIGIIPLFFLMLDIGLLNTRVGLIIVYIAMNLPFTIFVLYGFFRTLPSELEDAAEIDGCSPAGAFFRVMLPMARGGIITVGIFDFIGIWNEYLYALVLISDTSIRTLPLGMANLYAMHRYHTDWTALLAGLVIAMVPMLVVYILFQSQFSKGVALRAGR